MFSKALFFDSFYFFSHKSIMGCPVGEFFIIGHNIEAKPCLCQMFMQILLLSDIVIKLLNQLKAFFLDLFVLGPSWHLFFVCLEGMIQISRCVVHYPDFYFLKLDVYALEVSRSLVQNLLELTYLILHVCLYVFKLQYVIFHLFLHLIFTWIRRGILSRRWNFLHSALFIQSSLSIISRSCCIWCLTIKTFFLLSGSLTPNNV